MYPDESEDQGESEAATPVEKPKLSMAPSWLMLGFIVGALFVWGLPPRQPVAPPVAERVEPPPVLAKLALQFTVIEAVFAEWGKYAVWDNDLTEVALWSSETKSYSECYEVLRTGGSYFFRSIPHLTHPVLTHGTRDDSPLQFTETEAQRAEWLGEKRQQTWRAISAAAREKAGATPPPPTGDRPRTP